MPSVDTRVVKMQFDNAQFEKGIQQSVSSIKNLKDNLNFTGAAKGLESVEKASKSVDLSGFSSAVENIKVQFSTMETVAIGALMNIGAQAADAGEKLIKSLSVDNISAGWSKYERRTAATQTIVNATGKSVEEVDEALEKLAWYSDETSYDFTAMVETIGKFTATGVDLDAAVDSVMGIANAAAVAGVNTTDANRAFYNLAQAMGSGSLKLQDYKSLELLVMTTKEFQQTLVDAAMDLGTLTKDVDGFTSTTTDANGHVGQFNADLIGLRDSLSSGWVTSDVMELAFSRYAEYTNKIYDVADAYDTVSEAMEAVGKEGYEFSAKALEAAQVAKTFTDVVDSVKDAVSTKWQQTFQLIFGNFEEAVDLWTDLSNRLWKMFAASGDTRNELLKLWRQGSGGYNREILIGSFSTLLDILQQIIDTVRNSFRKVFFGDLDKYTQNAANIITRLTQRFSSFTNSLKPSAYTLDRIGRVLKGLFSIFKIGYQAVQPFIIVIKNLFNALFPIKNIGGSLLTTLAKLSDKITNFANDSEVVDKWRKVILSFGNVIVQAAKNVREFFRSIKEWLKASPIFSSLGKSVDSFMSSLRTGFLEFDLGSVREFSESIKDEFGGISVKVNEVLNTISDFLSKYFEKYKDIAVDGIQSIGEKVSSISNKVISGIKSLGEKSQNESKEQLKETLAEEGEIIETETKSFGERFKEFFSNLQQTIDTKFPGLGRFIGNVKEMFKSAFDSIASYFKDGFTLEGLINLLSSGLIVGVLVEVKKIFSEISDIGDKIAKILKPFAKISDSITKLLNEVGGVLKAWQTSIKADAVKKIAISVAILAGSMLVLSLIDANDLENATAALTVIMFALGSLVKNFNVGKMTSVGSYLFGLGASIIFIAGAIAIIADLKVEQLIQGLGTVVFLISALIGVSATLSKLKAGVRFKSFASGIIALGFGLLMLCAPIAILGHMKWGTLIKATIVIGGLVTVLGLLSAYGKTGESNIPKLAAGLILFSVAIGLLIPPILILAALPLEGVITSVGAIAALMVVMGLVSRIAKDSHQMVDMALAMIALAGAFDIFVIGLWLLVPVIAKIIELGPAEFAIGLAAVVGTFIALGYAANKVGKNADGIFEFSKAALKLGAGIALAVGGLYYFCKIVNNDLSATIAKGLRALSLLIKPIAELVTLLVVELVKSVANMVNPITEAVLDATVQMLAQIEEHIPEILEKVLSIILKIIVGLREYIPKLVNEAGKLIVDFINEVINFTKELNVDSNALGAVILGLIGLVAIFNYMSSLKKKAKEALVVGEIMILLAAELAAIMIAMSLFGTGEDFFLIATGLAEGLAAMAGAFAILDKIKADPASAAKTAAAFDVFFGIVTAMFALVGGLFSGLDWLANQINPKEDNGSYVLEWLNTTVLIFQKIGEALGGFVGGIVGGIVGGVLDGLMSTLPTLGSCLSLFWTNAQWFVEGVSSIPSNFLESVTNITAAILLLTAADFINSILNFFGAGGDSWVKLGQELVAFGPYLRDFGIIISETDPTAIEAGANAALALGKFANSLPSRDGKLQEWFGNKETLGEFGAGLSEFGATLVEFDKSIRGIDSEGNEHPINTELIKNAAEASGYLADFANKLPDHDGKLQWFLGDATLTTFATELNNFAPALVSFCDKIADLNTQGVDKAVDAASVVAGFEGNLPKHNGIVQMWTGDQTLTTFAGGMEALGDGLAKFHEKAKNVNKGVVSAGVWCASLLSELENGLPRTGGLMGLLFGDKDIEEFGNKLEPLGDGVSRFSAKIQNVDSNALTKAQTAAGVVKALGEALPTQTSVFDQWFGEGKKISFDNISSDLPLLGAGLAAFGLAMNLTSENSLNKGIIAGEMLQALNSGLPTQTSVFDQWFGEGRKISFDHISTDLPTLGTSIKEFSENLEGTKKATLLLGKFGAQMICDLNDKLPTDPSKLENYFGVNQKISWTDLAAGLPELGKGINDFAANVSGMSSDALNNGVNAASLILDLYNKLPTATSLYDKLFGEGGTISMSTVAAELPGLGSSLADFVGKFKDESKLEIAKAGMVASTLATITTNLPTYSSFADKIFPTEGDGTESISTVAGELPDLGTALRDFLDNVGTVTDNDVTVGELVGKIMSAIGDNLPEDKDWWEKLTGGGQMSLTDFGNQLGGLAKGLNDFATEASKIENPDDLLTAIDNLGQLANMETMLATLEKQDNLVNFSQALKDLGNMGVDYFIVAFKEKDSEIEDAASHLMTYLANSIFAHQVNAIDAAKDTADRVLNELNSDTYLAYFTNSGMQIALNIGTGLMTHADVTDPMSPANKMGIVVNRGRNYLESLKPKFKETGENLMDGFLEGIKSKSEDKVYPEIEKVGTKIVDKFNASMEIASPSKATARSAKYFIEGFVNYLKGSTPLVDNAVDNVGNNAIDNMNYIIQRAMDYVNNNLDSSPVITPVLDLSDIQNGVNNISNLVGNRAISIGSSITADQSKKSASKIRDKSQTSSNDLTSEIRLLREDMANYNENIRNIQIVMDTGAMVGTMTPMIDRELGKRSVRAGRRN